MIESFNREVVVTYLERGGEKMRALYSNWIVNIMSAILKGTGGYIIKLFLS